MSIDLVAEISSAILGFVFAQYLIPVTKKVADYIKDSKGLFGKIYQKYYKTLGKYFFLTKKTDPALTERKFEYKIFIEDNIATCYCSKILDFRQNIFNVINGKVNRVGQNENYEVFFTGNLNGNYFEWSETHNQNEKRIIHALYNTQGNHDNIVGSSVEASNRTIATPICVLSRKKYMYDSLEDLKNNTPHLEKMLSNVTNNPNIIIEI